MLHGSLQALVFDFDGLILETEGPAFSVMRDLFDAYGVALTTDVWLRVVGGTGGHFDLYEHLATTAGRTVDREGVRAEFRRRHAQAVAGMSALPGVAELIAEAQAAELRLGVASSSSREWVEPQLRRLGLFECFHAVRTRDDVARTKPEPDLYLAVLTALGVHANAAVAFEDSPNGVAAAKAAGVFCVAVPNVTTAALPLDHADLRVASLTEVGLARLRTLHSRRYGPP